MPSSDLLSVAEASKQKRTPGRTIRHAILRGDLVAHKLPGATGSYVIRQDDLDRWAEERSTKASESEASA